MVGIVERFVNEWKNKVYFLPKSLENLRKYLQKKPLEDWPETIIEVSKELNEIYEKIKVPNFKYTQKPLAVAKIDLSPDGYEVKVKVHHPRIIDPSTGEIIELGTGKVVCDRLSQELIEDSLLYEIE